jgi:hypothetical protein
MPGWSCSPTAEPRAALLARSLDMDGRYVRGRVFNLSLGTQMGGPIDTAASTATSAIVSDDRVQSLENHFLI